MIINYATRKRRIIMSILYGLLVTLYVFVCAILVLLVLVQKGKGSMGLGSFGGSTQMLFGGSGGQDLFQKITWGLGAVFLLTSLLLALMKSSQVSTSKYVALKSSVKTEQTTT
jgi:preprotein translocase subunit SecG